MYGINRTDITILQILESQSADNEAFGITIAEIMSELQAIGNKLTNDNISAAEKINRIRICCKRCIGKSC